jgi:outer membrane biosynthesis protein TonB
MHLEMSELTVENLDAPGAELPPEPPPEPPPLERHVAFQNEEVNIEAAPKRRGRPKAEPKPKPEAKKRGRPPKPREEPVPEAVVEPPPPLDIHALMQPLVEHYINQSAARRESARRSAVDGLFQNMMQRRGAF